MEAPAAVALSAVATGVFTGVAACRARSVPTPRSCTGVAVAPIALNGLRACVVRDCASGPGPAFAIASPGRSGYDVVQSTGQKIEFGETRRLMLVRPDRLRMEEVSSDGTRDLVIFDGRNITVLNADEKVFAQAPQPASLDDALGYFVRDLKMRMPLALMLTTRFPEVLANRISAIDYVERTEILGAPAHHIAGRGENVDFQFWIRDGERPLPLRLILTYRDSPGQPQHWAIFADWDTSPSVADSDFEFAPPADARQIPFAVQFRRPEASPTPPAANGGVQP